MGFFANNNRILIRDEDEHIMFDTDEGLFAGTDFISGTKVMPQRQATWSSGTNFSNINVDDTYTLGSINPNADVVVGSFFVSTGAFTILGKKFGASDQGWFAAGGTYVHLMLGGNSPSFGDATWHCDNKAAYTFLAGGGLLQLNERVGLRAAVSFSPVNTTITLPPVTFQYKIFCGIFV